MRLAIIPQHNTTPKGNFTSTKKSLSSIRNMIDLISSQMNTGYET